MDSTLFLRAVAEDRLDLAPISIDVLQLNITRLCNQACVHCHVAASPTRTETMSDEVIERCLEIVSSHPGIRTVDITGGAPELHAGFERLIEDIRALDRHVIVRHNLTVTMDRHPRTGGSMRHLPELFARNRVEVTGSLPCYLPENTDAQRGARAHERSIDSLRLLNAQGYGVPGSGLTLNLVTNPAGPQPPAPQRALEEEFRRELGARYGVVFNSLFALANMPIGRFAVQMDELGSTDEYRDRLAQACNPAAAAGVMCRSMLSVAHDGTLYDCDFNQMLGLAIGEERPRTVFDFDERALMVRVIRFADHCLGCTAGAGSSCWGATAG
ncbi:MAG: arsenosugar biosynthesis radical SAM (seleno)protein ArsS [Coriobacteriia bacterium]